MMYILTVNDVVWLETSSADEAFRGFRRWAGAVKGAKVNLRFERIAA